MDLFHDTVDLEIKLDPSSRLPLLSEEQKIFDLVINYLQLPYYVVEYACGKKCSMIIHKLYTLGIPSFAIKRGMIMEKDMSDNALEQRDFNQRIHSLTTENSLFHKLDFSNKILMQLLEEAGLKPDKKKRMIQAGEFSLSNAKTLQFVEARSHIFTILLFWDEKNQKVKERVVDPTIDSDELFLVTQLRKYLQASESLIFTAPLLGEFRLDEKYLTEEQVKEYFKILKSQSTGEFSNSHWYEVIRKMNSASRGSAGDPETWTYANNMAVSDLKHHEFQLYNTGKGNPFFYLVLDLIAERENRQEEKVVQSLEDIQKLEEKLNISEIIAMDSRWCEIRMAPLIDLVNTISHHTALEELSERIKSGEPLYKAMTYRRGVGMNRLFGISFRIRERLEELARVSTNKDGQIDALALSPLYTEAVKNCIQQMNRAGMQVIIDKVGNVHGLFTDEETVKQVKKQSEKLSALCKKALCFCSHIDTVSDGGKFDGRLGVVTGIEVIHLLNDLQRFYGIKFKYPETNNPLMVSVFMGEEMYFTGMGVSMPGSSAVAGLAETESIYDMTNPLNETYIANLNKMLYVLQEEVKNKKINLVNTFKKEKPLNDCFEPSLFYTKHTIERHIEQGSTLHSKKVPLVLVDTIMGIHQQDFVIEGANGELAALLLNNQLRRLSMNERFNSLRVTCGMLQHADSTLNDPEEVTYGMRWKLIGMKNHAGSTAFEERKDAGVAAGRLAAYFLELVDELNGSYDSKLKPIIGAPQFMPGTNRNVIPGEALVTLALGNSAGEDFKNVVMQKCLGFITGTLALDVSNGGEGLVGYNVHPVNYINTSRGATLSLDVRFPDKKVKNSFLKETIKICKNLEKQLHVSIGIQIKQELEPLKLSQSGQVLQIERSYGGSHNPNETELTRDVLRGSLLQLSAAIDYVHEKDTSGIKLYSYVNKYIPQGWKKSIPQFKSGALHDTCNIAKRAILDQ